MNCPQCQAEVLDIDVKCGTAAPHSVRPVRSA